MSHASPPDVPAARGFVLVGVVMFVLALTILGLSVFSLSSYEAQFMRNSRDQIQAFNDAMGGLERAAYALARTDSLESVNVHLPAGIDSTVSWQWSGTTQKLTGLVNPDSIVWTRVRAHRGSAVRVVSAGFVPGTTENYYARTIHTSSWVNVDIQDGSGHSTRNHSVQLGAAVRQASSDFTWTGYLATPVPADQGTMSVPEPAAESFITSHLAGATQAPYDPGSKTYRLLNPDPNQVKYFSWPDLPGRPFPDNQWTLYDQDDPKIEVKGMVVWLFPKGVHLGTATSSPVTVEGDGHSHGNDCLVIVAERGEAPEAGLGLMGIRFFGGLQSTGSKAVPIFLVTSGVLEVDMDVAAAASPTVDYFSAFAGGVYLRGPVSPTYRARLLHDANAPEDRPNGLLDRLLRLHALPNSTGGSSPRFEMLAGTWQDVTP